MGKINDIKIMEDMQKIVLIENEVGVIKYVNEAFCKFHGINKEEETGKKVFDYIIPEDREACNVENVVTPENPFYRIVGRSKRADGIGASYSEDAVTCVELADKLMA